MAPPFPPPAFQDINYLSLRASNIRKKKTYNPTLKNEKTKIRNTGDPSGSILENKLLSTAYSTMFTEIPKNLGNLSGAGREIGPPSQDNRDEYEAKLKKIVFKTNIMHKKE